MRDNGGRFVGRGDAPRGGEFNNSRREHSREFGGQDRDRYINNRRDFNHNGTGQRGGRFVGGDRGYQLDRRTANRTHRGKLLDLVNNLYFRPKI